MAAEPAHVATDSVAAIIDTFLEHIKDGGEASAGGARAVKRAFRWAETQEYIARSPLARWRAPKASIRDTYVSEAARGIPTFRQSWLAGHRSRPAKSWPGIAPRRLPSAGIPTPGCTT